jgi:hypothetical protein
MREAGLADRLGAEATIKLGLAPHHCDVRSRSRTLRGRRRWRLANPAWPPEKHRSDKAADRLSKMTEPPSGRKRRRTILTDVETAERVKTLATARDLFPAVFGDDAKPLAIGAHTALRTALNTNVQAIEHLLAWWTRRPEYLRAVAEPDSRRWNLDGSVAGDVSPQQRVEALSLLGAPDAIRLKSPQPMGPTIMSATVSARSIKATVVLEAADIARLKVLPGTSRVALQVNVAGRALLAELNAKSVRKCIAAIEAAGQAGANVVLQGRLDGDQLLEAGIVAQPKAPKPAAEAA